MKSLGDALGASPYDDAVSTVSQMCRKCANVSAKSSHGCIVAYRLM